MRQVTATALIGSPPRRRERGHLGFDTQVRRQQSRRRKAAPRRASANNHSSQPAAGRVRGDQPTQAFSVGNHPSLLEGALIPAARDANDMVVAEGNEKVGGLKIFPATAVNKALNIVNRGKLLARVVAVQTIDNLRQ